jgi:hypothetical protein
MATYDKDLELWSNYRAAPGKRTLEPLLNNFKGTITKSVNKWGGGNVAPAVLDIKAKKIAIDAFNNFNPAKAKLNTHLTNHLKGISRPVYETQVARMPESRTLKVGTYLTANQELVDNLGRLPTAKEMSDSLKWNIKEVHRFRNELRSQYSTDPDKPIPPGFETFNSEVGELDFIYHDLNDQDKLVFEGTTGYMGSEVQSTKALINSSGLTSGQISHSKRRIKSKVMGYRGLK